MMDDPRPVKIDSEVIDSIDIFLNSRNFFKIEM